MNVRGILFYKRTVVKSCLLYTSICTDFEVWREIIKKYNCGICVTPTNKNEISGAISFLLKNPDIAKLMGQNGRRAVEETYNWSRCV